MSNDVAMVEVKPQHSKKIFLQYLGKSFDGFKEALGFKESQGNYFRVNTFGYLGKYQFGRRNFKTDWYYNPNHFLKYTRITRKSFLANAQRNKWILRRDIKRLLVKQLMVIV